MRTISPSCTRGPVPSMPGHISLEADCDQLELLLNQVEVLEADEARIDSEIQDLVIKKKSVHSDLLLLIKKIAKIASTLSELRLSKSPSGLRTYKRKKVGKSAESVESPADHKNEAEPVPSIVSIESLASPNCDQSVEESVASSPACESSTSLSDGGVTMQVLHRKMLNELERPHDLGSPQDSESVSHTHAEQNHHPSVKSDQFVFVNTEISRLDRPSGGEIVNKKDRAHKTSVCTDSEIQLNSLTDGPSREKRQRFGDSENQRVAVKEEVEAEEVLEDPLDAHLSEISTTGGPLGFDSISKAVFEECSVTDQIMEINRKLDRVLEGQEFLKELVAAGGNAEKTKLDKGSDVKEGDIILKHGAIVTQEMLAQIQKDYKPSEVANKLCRGNFSVLELKKLPPGSFFIKHEKKLSELRRFTKRLLISNGHPVEDEVLNEGFEKGVRHLVQNLRRKITCEDGATSKVTAKKKKLAGDGIEDTSQDRTSSPSTPTP